MAIYSQVISVGISDNYANKNLEFSYRLERHKLKNEFSLLVNLNTRNYLDIRSFNNSMRGEKLTDYFGLGYRLSYTLL